MHLALSYFRNRPHLLILALILLVGLLFRTYQIVERLEFAHDGDLYSWIIKNILIDRHIRLIGQETSAAGIFIGGLFYYLLIPFFLLTKMDPVGVIYFSVILGSLTIISLYFVLSRLFKTEVGLIAAAIYAILITNINTDRWVVPTITTNLWVIWYFYVVIKITRGDFRVLPILGILISLIWHVHIALIPTLIAIPAAIYLSRRLPNVKQIIQFIIVFSLTSLPFFIFEIKHGFRQTTSLITNFTTYREGAATGLYKFTMVIYMIAKNTSALFLELHVFNQSFNLLFTIGILFFSFLLIKKNLLLKKELAVLLVWILGVVIFFGLSSSPISEYYFSNLEIIFLTLISLYLCLLYKSSNSGRMITMGILLFITIKNAYFITSQNYYNKGYVERKAAVNYIKIDMEKKGYPCIGINYISAIGENVGFRYFFYLKNVRLAVPGRGSPVYSIVVPDEYSPNVKVKFGHIGVIPPEEVLPTEVIKEACSGDNTNLTDPMFGYVD